MRVEWKITDPYQHNIKVSQAGLVAIFATVRCRSREQSGLGMDEDARIEIDGMKLEKLPPGKRMQLFDIPPAWNGSYLRNLKKTVVVLVMLPEGKHVVSIIPQPSAFIEELDFRELRGRSRVAFDFQDTAEDGDRRPWYTFVLVDLPLRTFSVEASITKRFRDSDDVKLIVDGEIRRHTLSGKYSRWYFIGAFLSWILKWRRGETRRISASLSENLKQGTHYLEIWADRKPALRRVKLVLWNWKDRGERKAAELILRYSSSIKEAAHLFNLDPVMVGAVIYQEQSTNVNFLDVVGDYIGGLLGINTSIGIGQIRVKTAELLERDYLSTLVQQDMKGRLSERLVRIERLRDPLINIRYVVAKLHFSQVRWERAGFDISRKPEILGTLYNVEDISRPIEPHAEPSANEFGEGVARNYQRVSKLLGLE